MDSNIINEHDGNGFTRLHIAVLRGSAGGVRKLLDMGADPNIRDSLLFGFTPATLSVLLGSVPVVEEFARDWRTDWDKQDAVGMSAKDYAAAADMPLSPVAEYH